MVCVKSSSLLHPGSAISTARHAMHAAVDEPLLGAPAKPSTAPSSLPSTPPLSLTHTTTKTTTTLRCTAAPWLTRQPSSPPTARPSPTTPRPRTRRPCPRSCPRRTTRRRRRLKAGGGARSAPGRYPPAPRPAGLLPSPPSRPRPRPPSVEEEEAEGEGDKVTAPPRIPRLLPMRLLPPAVAEGGL